MCVPQLEAGDLEIRQAQTIGLSVRLEFGDERRHQIRREWARRIGMARTLRIERTCNDFFRRAFGRRPQPIALHDEIGRVREAVADLRQVVFAEHQHELH